MKSRHKVIFGLYLAAVLALVTGGMLNTEVGILTGWALLILATSAAAAELVRREA